MAICSKVVASKILFGTIFALAGAVGVNAAGLPEASSRAASVAARVRPHLEHDLALLNLRYGAPVFVRIFKRERELELWLKNASGAYSLFRTYPICTYSGELGPKQTQGDNQAPEGFYAVGLSQMNPNSRFHLAFNLGYPNAYDRAHGRTGNFLMVHGNCVSIGCYAMGDAAIEEIYTLADAALQHGQTRFFVHAFPFRLEPSALAAETGSPWYKFWSELKAGYAAFEKKRVPPEITVRGGRYSVYVSD